MQLYLNDTCPMVPPVLDILKELKVPYEPINIDHDLDARQHLITIANGNLSVPTLDLGDGRILIEPTPETVRLLLTNQSEAVIKARQKYRTWQSRVLTGVAFGFIAFGLGSLVTTSAIRAQLLPPVGALMLAALVFGLLSLLPPINKALSAIAQSRWLRWRTNARLLLALRLGLVMALSFVLGISTPGDAPAKIALLAKIGLFAGLLVLVANFTRPAWLRQYKQAQKLQKVLGFVLLLVVVGSVVLRLMNQTPHLALLSFAVMALTAAMCQIADVMQPVDRGQSQPASCG